MPRSAKILIAMFGVWRAGAACVITENTDPPKRIKFIQNDCSCKLEINSENWEDILRTKSIVGYEDVGEHDAAYVVYTSGTTGNPKGIIHEYGNFKECCDSAYFNKKPIFAEYESFAYIASLNFIAIIFFLLPILKQNKTKFYIISDSIKKEPEKLLLFLKENNITSIFLPPSYVKAIGEEKPSFLKKVIVGSEPALNIFPMNGVSIFNIYGMSESGFYVGVFKIDNQYDICPIGNIQFDKKLYLLNENGNEIDNGDIGEICFDNPHFRGYINHPEETKRVFKNNIYHSNDMAKRLSNGDYVIIGRKNDMIKINGNRIEPAEVESVIRNELDIDWCGVRGFENGENTYLVAYFIDDITIDINELRDRLLKSLPQYMIPTYFIKIDKIPVNKNGKLDRKSLPNPNVKANEMVLPETEFEKEIFDIVSRELNTKEFGVTTNLISMGLTSIKAIELSVLINKETNHTIKASDILSKPYIKEWINFVDKDIEKININCVRKTYPLTPNQLSICYNLEKDENRTPYNTATVFKLGNVDYTKVFDTLNKIIKLHPVFKSHIIKDEYGNLLLERRDEADLFIQVNKLDFEPDSEFFQKRVRPFNLLNDDLSRFEIYYIDKNVYLFIDILHIIFDGASFSLLLYEIFDGYKGKTLKLEKLNFFDYSLYYNNWLKSDNYLNASKYFSNLIAGTESFMYPYKNTNNIATGKEVVIKKQISRKGINEYCSKLGITENAFFATILTQVFHRISGKDTIQIATISSGRNLEQFADTYGMFIHMVPLVSRNVKGNIEDILKSMQEQIISTINYDRYPYIELIKKFDVKVNVLYTYQGDTSDSKNIFDNLEITEPAVDAIAPLSIDIFSGEEAFDLLFYYDYGLYTKEEIENLFIYIFDLTVSLLFFEESEVI